MRRPICWLCRALPKRQGRWGFSLRMRFVGRGKAMDIMAGSKDARLRRKIGYVLNRLASRTVTTGKSSAVLVGVLDRDFDLVVLDTDLEGMNGQETFRILRRIRPKLPVIFLHRNGEDLSDVLQRGDTRTAVMARSADRIVLYRAVEEMVSTFGDRGHLSAKCKSRS